MPNCLAFRKRNRFANGTSDTLSRSSGLFELCHRTFRKLASSHAMNAAAVPNIPCGSTSHAVRPPRWVFCFTLVRAIEELIFIFHFQITLIAAKKSPR